MTARVAFRPGFRAFWALWTLWSILAGPARAETLVVRPGTDWNDIVDRAKPGDEILLEPGVHRPVRLEGLAGDPGRPIVIRPRDERTLAEIRGGTRGLELVRPAHVEVRNLFLRESSGEGLVVSGDPGNPARGILIRNCLISQCGVASRTPAVRFSGVEGLILTDSRVHGFEETALSIEHCREIRIERTQAVAEPTETGRTGVRIGPGSEGITLDRIGLGPSIRTAFSIGIGRPADAADGGTGPLASRIAIRNSLVERNAVFAEVGSAREVDLSRNTIIDPLDTVLLLVAPPPGRPSGSGVRFRENLVSWRPGTLQRFGRLGPGVEGPADVEYGANLWHSAELPAARSLRGAWQGRIAEPQVTDLDPRLDNHSTPREPAARNFGFEPLPRPAPPVPPASAR